MALNPLERAPGAELPRTASGFQLLRELGRGGMGVVYEARELASGRTVALKILAAELRFSEEAFERFRREARLAAAISDRHCVFVYGAHEVEGSPAISMELCSGDTLDQKLACREAIPIETAVRWTLEILTGLEAAHATGVVHRDVKPSNCFTTADGHAKIGDFGLSRTLESNLHLTQSGAFLGSPLYASPEQIRGREVDLRSDLYSCGATLYALLTGRAPYSGSNVGEVLARILSETPPAPRSIRPDVPRDLERVVLRAMERDPKRRFQDHAKFREALQPFAATSITPAGPKRRFAAYVIDYALIQLLVAALMGATTWAGLDWAELDPQRPWMFRSLLGTGVLGSVPWIVFTILEGWLGAGPGKWAVGQRVVAIDTQQPSLARAALRSAIFYGPGVLVLCVAMQLELSQATYSAATIFASIIFNIALLTTMRRVNGYRAVHDLLSGTRVIQKGSPFARLRHSSPPPSTTLRPADGVPTTVGVYEIQGMVGPSPEGLVLAARDPQLDRSVWIHARNRTDGASDETRRALARGGRLRWLDSLRADGTHYEVFESPGGTSLVDWTRGAARTDWPTAHRFLVSLADELAATSTLGRDAERFHIAQVWIDRAWNPRLLDFPIGADAEASANALELLAQAAQRMLLAGKGATVELPPDLPAHAEPVVRRLLGRAVRFVDLKEARRELAQLSGRPSGLARRTRVAQMIVSTAPSILLAFLSVLIAIWVLPQVSEFAEATVYVTELEAHATDSKSATPLAPTLSSDEVKARQVLVSHAFSTKFGTATAKRSLTPASQEIVREASALYPDPIDSEVAWASGVTANALSASDREELATFPRLGRRMLMYTLPAIVAMWGVCGMLSAFLFDGGMTLMLCGIRVRSRRGLLASRLRCAWRCAIAWLPFALAYGVGTYLTSQGNSAAGWTVTCVTAIVHAYTFAFALWRPTAGLHDRLAGTTLVAR